MIAIVKYRAGNVASVQYALNRLGAESVVTDDPEQLRQAERVIFPGVGEASSAMASLRQNGLDEVLRSLSQPFLGICLGMQLMAEWSAEGNTDCLGILPGKVVPFAHTQRKIHMGWNNLALMEDAPSSGLWEAMPAPNDCYFVHGYYLPVIPETLASSQFEDISFTAAAQKDNFYGVQFHPEKSGKVGAQLLQNFLRI